jgi:hypothetical protein
VYALDTATGAVLWSFTTGSLVLSSPAVVNGVVYVSSFDGNVYALGLHTIGYMTDTYAASGESVLRRIEQHIAISLAVSADPDPVSDRSNRAELAAVTTDLYRLIPVRWGIGMNPTRNRRRAYAKHGPTATFNIRGGTGPGILYKVTISLLGRIPNERNTRRQKP